jgi:hypothetical protein
MSSAVGASIGKNSTAVIKILGPNDQKPGYIVLPSPSSSELITPEGPERSSNNTFIGIKVSRTSGADGTITISYKTLDIDGTAVSGQDYKYTEGSLTWLDGESDDKYVLVEIINDAIDENDERFGISFFEGNPSEILASQPVILPITISGPNDLPTIDCIVSPPSGVVFLFSIQLCSLFLIIHHLYIFA